MSATIYRVTLDCGCRFWEHRLGTDPAPEIGRVDLCFATHVTSHELAAAANPLADGVI